MAACDLRVCIPGVVPASWQLLEGQVLVVAALASRHWGHEAPLPQNNLGQVRSTGQHSHIHHATCTDLTQTGFVRTE